MGKISLNKTLISSMLGPPIYKKGVPYHYFNCIDCGQPHLTQSVNGGQPRKPRCSICAHKAGGLKRIGVPRSEETKAKVSLALMGHKSATPNPFWLHTREARKKQSLAKIGKPSGKKGWKASPEVRARMSQAMTRVVLDRSELYDLYVIKSKTATEIALMKACDTGTILRRLRKFGIAIRSKSINQKKLWAKPEYQKMMRKILLKAVIQSPNRVEQRLQAMLDELYPKQWKYTGDGSFIIAGLNPDWVNIDGRKQIIELFGTYWHSSDVETNWKRSELGRMMIFKSYGYDTLVIWEHELKQHPEVVVAKLREFHDMKVKRH